jgi:hypothetical protein
VANDGHFLRKLVRSKSKVEARKWLAGNSPSCHRGISEMTPEKSSALVSRLYEWGAIEVFATDFKVNKPYEAADILLIQLPLDSVSRTRIIDWISENAQRQGLAPVEDHGPHYEFAWFD